MYELTVTYFIWTVTYICSTYQEVEDWKYNYQLMGVTNFQIRSVV